MLRFDPFGDLERLSDQVTRQTRSIMAFDAVRNDDEIWIYFDLPGVKADDVELSVEKNELTIRADRRWDAGDWQVLASERPQGSFSRQLLLNDALDTDEMEARLDDGVLTIRIPVAETSKQRRIEVKQGSHGAQTIDTAGSESDA